VLSETEDPELIEHEMGCGPGVEERLRLVDPARAVGASIPSTVRALQGQQPGTPAFGGDASAFGRHDRRRLGRQIAHHLPTESRVRVEEPVDGSGHTPSVTGSRLAMQT